MTPLEAQCAEKLYSNSGNRPLLNMLGSLMPTVSKRALDCGCGAGDNAAILKQLGWSVTGITISPEEQRSAALYCTQVLIHDLEAGLPRQIGEPFQLILLSHVLEHLLLPGKLLDAAREMLDVSGCLLVALPNILYFRQRLRFLLGKFEYEETGLMDNTHVRFYTFDTGRKLLEQHGFEVIKSQGHGGMPLWRLRDVLPGTWSRSLDRLAQRKFPGCFGWQSLYLARRNR